MIWGAAPLPIAIAASAAAAGGTVIAADTRLTAEIGVVMRNGGAVVPIEWSASGVGVFGNATVSIELLPKVLADLASRLEMAGRVSIDGSLFIESGRGVMVDPRIAADTSRILAADAALGLEFPASLRDDGSLAVEWSGGIETARDTAIAIEWLGTAQGGPIFATDALRVVIRGQSGVLQWMGAVRLDEQPAVEGLIGSLRDVGLAAESLTGGSTITGNTISPFEAIAASPAIVLSVQADSNRRRLLATFGRIRLLRRN